MKVWNLLRATLFRTLNRLATVFTELPKAFKECDVCLVASDMSRCIIIWVLLVMPRCRRLITLTARVSFRVVIRVIGTVSPYVEGIFPRLGFGLVMA